MDIRRDKKIIIYSFLAVLLTTCIDPYPFTLKDYESILVVEGLITDAPVADTIKLTRTFQNREEGPSAVRGAYVKVSGDDGTNTVFSEIWPGIYISDPDLFRGVPGTTYTLSITADGKDYRSDACLLLPVPEIDSVSFVKDSEFINDGSKEVQGIRVFVSATALTDKTEYLRWDYEETWKIKMPYPEAYRYLGHGQVIAQPVENQICWKSDASTRVIARSIPGDADSQSIIQPLTFINPAVSTRLTEHYSILVKQYSLTKAAFDYWENMKQVSEERGDIFDKQPFFIPGNIHSLSNNNEKVLGFFQTSAVKEKRIFINKYDIRPLNLPRYYYNCEIIRIGPIDYSGGVPGETPTITFDMIYNIYTGMGYVFVYPEFNGLSLERLVFTKPVCSDCSLSANPVMPDFWEENP